MSKYKALFLNESGEHLSSLDRLILQLEKTPDNLDIIGELFRSAHSMKGMAASMGFQPIADLAHSLEDLLEALRDQKKKTNSTIIDLLLEGRDLLEVFLKAVEKDEPLDPLLEGNGKSKALMQRLNQLNESDESDEVDDRIMQEIGHRALSVDLQKIASKENEKAINDFIIPESEENFIRVQVQISPRTAIPGARGFLIHKKLIEHFSVINCIPVLERVKKGEFDRSIEFHIEGQKLESEIKSVLEKISDVTEIKFLNSNASKVVENPNLEKGSAFTPLEDFIRPTKSASTAISASATGKIKVSTQFLDDLINSTGEILISAFQIRNLVSETSSSMVLNSNAREMVKNIRDLYERVLTVRMTPLNIVTEKLPRVVRDLARKTKKSVRIEMSGTNILLDRAILEELDSPLLHIIRNAVDHGIELPEERKNAGKPERATIELRTQIKKGMVVITLTDDGRGMDADLFRKKAVDKNLISSEHAQKISKQDALMLVCLPGFSTQEKVTELSGRGVGMDAVKSMVESYEGMIEINSQLGKSTTFTLYLPLTVSIVNVLLFGVSDQTYAFPISRVERTMELAAHEIQKQQGQDVFIFQREMVRLIHLGEIFGMSRLEKPKTFPIALVDFRGRKCGFHVDSFIGQEEVVLKPLTRPLKDMPLITGATVLGNGRATFILDVNQLIQTQ